MTAIESKADVSCSQVLNDSFRLIAVIEESVLRLFV